MKNIILAAAAIFCGTSSGLTSNEPSISIVQPATQQQQGKEAISQIRKDYEEGRYDDFLKEIDSSYEEVVEKNQLAGLASFRKGTQIDQKWAETAQLLQKEKNKQLLEITANDSSPFAQKVKSASTDPTTPEQVQAIQHLAQFRQLVPQSGLNSDENKLIDLDLEYEYKSIHLDMPVINGEPVSDRREKHYALKMEHANRLLALAQTFEDTTLKKEAELYAKNLDDRLGQNWDQNDLSSLINGKAKPITSLQQKVALILETHQEKISDLTKQMLSDQNSHAAQK